jgi:hypothetical protein
VDNLVNYTYRNKPSNDKRMTTARSIPAIHSIVNPFALELGFEFSFAEPDSSL